ncbi:MAG: PorV/PorQ family protein [Acidobacteriota bacterium]
MKTKFLALVLLCSASTLFAQSAATGLSFLKLGVGARTIAMGETGAASSADASAPYYNPALLSFAAQTDLSLMHKEWIADISTEYFGAAIPGETVALGFSFNATNTGSIDVRTQPGDPAGTFNAHDMAITGSAGVKLSDELAIGISAKFLYEKLYVDEASGYAVDLGAAYRVSPSLTLGAALSNLGSMNEMRNEALTLPSLLRAGASYAGTMSEDFAWRANAELVTIFKQSESHVHLGGEVSYDKTVALRAGYETGYDAKAFTGGIGVAYGMLAFDYAFVPFSSGFSTTHTFSLSFRL